MEYPKTVRPNIYIYTYIYIYIYITDSAGSGFTLPPETTKLGENIGKSDVRKLNFR